MVCAGVVCAATPGTAVVGPAGAAARGRATAGSTPLVAYGSSKRMVTGTRAGSRIKTKKINDDCYHTPCRSAAIFGVQTVLSYLF